jgi:hypothetical protein
MGASRRPVASATPGPLPSGVPLDAAPAPADGSTNCAAAVRLSDLRAAIPPACFRKSLPMSLSYLVLDLAILLALVALYERVLAAAEWHPALWTIAVCAWAAVGGFFAWVRRRFPGTQHTHDTPLLRFSRNPSAPLGPTTPLARVFWCSCCSCFCYVMLGCAWLARVSQWAAADGCSRPGLWARAPPVVLPRGAQFHPTPWRPHPFPRFRVPAPLFCHRCYFSCCY